MVSNMAARSGRDPGRSPGTELPPEEAAPFYETVLERLGLDRKGGPCILEVAEEGVIQFTRRLTPEEMEEMMVPLNPDGSNGIVHAR